MKWRQKAKPKPGDTRERFAVFPTLLDDGYWVWWEPYWEVMGGWTASNFPIWHSALSEDRARRECRGERPPAPAPTTRDQPPRAGSAEEPRSPVYGTLKVDPVAQRVAQARLLLAAEGAKQVLEYLDEPDKHLGLSCQKALQVLVDKYVPDYAPKPMYRLDDEG